MIIARTPLRISFAGGGTDLPVFYKREPGAVISTAINKHIYVSVNKKFDNRIRITHTTTEIVDQVDELEHELTREVLRFMGIKGGIEISSLSDIPSQGTGLGSSSAYTVGLLNALYAYQGKCVSPERLAKEACQIEIEICGKPIGKQDQYIAAYGGFRFLQFCPDGTTEVATIPVCPETASELESNLLLLYTGRTRSADSILAEQASNTRYRQAAGDGLRRMRDKAQRLREALLGCDLSVFGYLLHEGWLEKRRLASRISNGDIDRWYDLALKKGALGGKILGAGGGGFMLLYAPRDTHPVILRNLPELRPIPFRLESEGSQIVYDDEENK